MDKIIHSIDSILETKASGNLDVTQDLNQPNGKSIAELLYEQKEEQEECNKTTK